MNYMIKNWKTSLVGFVSICTVVVSTWLPQYSAELHKMTEMMIALGLLAAKDGNQTGL
jgi:hypothetical protein